LAKDQKLGSNQQNGRKNSARTDTPKKTKAMRIKHRAYTRTVNQTAQEFELSVIPNFAPGESNTLLERSFLGRLSSNHSRAAYSRAVRSFRSWLAAQAPGETFCYSTVLRFKQAMLDAEESAALTNQRLAALRNLANEAEKLDLLSSQEARRISSISGIKQSGVRLGNWLSQDETNTLLGRPDRSTLRGVRDFAILSLLFQCGLRRAELTSIEVVQLARIEDRCVIKNLEGKGRRTRTVPVPSLSENAINTWLHQSGIRQGRIFRAVSKHDTVWGEGLSTEAVFNIFRFYAKQTSKYPNSQHDTKRTPSPHDARRTFAKLCRQKKGPLEEIQQLLGHKSILTTMNYIGDDEKIKNSINDLLQFCPQ
jgi:site-specific recombinase XerD